MHHRWMFVCPKECEGQQNRQQMPDSSQSHKTKQLLWPYLQKQLVPSFCLSFSCWKWKISNISLFCIFGCWWEESPQQGPKALAPYMPVSFTEVACTHRATLPVLQGKAGASHILLLLMQVSRPQEGPKWGTKSLLSGSLLIICSTCPCRVEAGIKAKATAVLSSA